MDIVLIIENTKIYAHKLVLATHSKKFEHLFLTIDKNPACVSLNKLSLSSEAVKKTISWMYGCSMKVTPSCWTEIIKVARQLRIEQLSEKLEKKLPEMLNLCGEGLRTFIHSEAFQVK